MKTRSHRDDLKNVLKCLALLFLELQLCHCEVSKAYSYMHYRRFLLHLKIDLFVGKSSKITTKKTRSLDEQCILDNFYKTSFLVVEGIRKDIPLKLPEKATLRPIAFQRKPT